MMDIAEKLRGACVGKPAVIQWPHRVLHEAADEIERLRDTILRLKFSLDGQDPTEHASLSLARQKFVAVMGGE
jgi:hypothetical protein